MPDTTHYTKQQEAVELRLPGGWTIPWHRAALWLIVVITLFRFWYITQLELIGDEAYYWQWSKHLDWSYYSKGPGVACTIWLGTQLFGDSVFGIRFFSVLLSAGTAYCLYRLARRMYDGETGFYAILIAAIIPLFGIGGILMTIDPLSVFFWAAAALAFWRAKDERAPWMWLLTGLLVGLGMLAKYTNIAELLCFLLFCATSAPYRKCLTRIPFWLMVVVALLCLTPVVIWNEQNHWVTMGHLLHRGALDSSWHFSLKEFSRFMVAQLGAYSPLVCLGVISAAVAGIWRLCYTEKPDPRLHFLVSLFWPLFLFYCFLSLNKAGEANWVVLCYISGILLAVVVWRKWLRLSIWLKGFVWLGAIVALVMSLILYSGAWLPLPLLKKDPMNRVRGWQDLARQVSDLQQQNGATFVIGSDYGVASLLSYYLKHQPQTYLVNAQGISNQYAFWSDYTDGFFNESAIYVTQNLTDDVPGQLRREFGKVELLKESYTTYQGRNVRKFRFYLCHEYGNFQGQEEKGQIGDKTEAEQ